MEQPCCSNKKKRFQLAEKAVSNTDLARLGTNLQIIVLHQNSSAFCRLNCVPVCYGSIRGPCVTGELL